MPDPEPGVDVHINPGDFAGIDAPRLERAVRHVLDGEGRAEGEVSVTLLDDGGIRELNREYLERDFVTDVIAFALHEPDTPVLGDVYIGFEQCRRQAAECGVDPGEELLRLVVHGTLHVLGYDHPEGEERTRSPMFERQEALVRALLDSGR